MHCRCDTLKRHFIIPSLISSSHAWRQLFRISRKSRCCREKKVSMVDDNRWKGRVNLGLWECRYFGWNPFTSDNTSSLNDASDVNGSICRQVSPRYNSSITHIRTHTRTHTHIHTWLFGTRRMRERTGVRALAMGHQLLVTGSAYAIEPNEIVNGPEWTGCGCRIERP